MATQQQQPRPRATALPHALRRDGAGGFPEPHGRHRLTQAEAQDLLAWLAAHGLQAELSQDEAGFVVRCRC